MITSTKRLVETNGVQLQVTEAGDRGAPVVVLAHGFPELAHSWRHQIPALAAAGYHVLAPDQRGYADSSRPQAIEDYDIVHLAGDLAGLLDDVAALLPKDGTAHVFSAALMELGAIVCTARTPKCGVCPLTACAWRSAGYPEADAPTRPVQKYAGTDRQVRGRLLDVLRASATPVTRAQLDVAWLTDTAQRDRALDSLLVDGLVEQTDDNRYALAGEGAS